MFEFHALLGTLFATSGDPVLILALAAVRVLGAFALLLAARTSRARADDGCRWSVTMTACLYALAGLQLIGALAMELPGAPLPSGWIFLLNGALAVLGLAFHFKHVRAIRRPGCA